jgi:hypothetical protein
MVDTCTTGILLTCMAMYATFDGRIPVVTARYTPPCEPSNLQPSFLLYAALAALEAN